MGKESNTKDRELILTRLLNAPVELVWEVWTKPEHIKNWWGPNGFTNTIYTMEFKKGGEWDLVMHGPDGTDFKNKSIFREIVKHRKIVYEHVSGPKFTATIEFDPRGEQTHLTWHMLFDTKEEFEQVIKTFKADQGLKQNVDKLSHYLQTRMDMQKKLKTDHKARVTTYLNFPGTTEQAFLFYKKVFGGTFLGDGLRRFGDVALPEGIPPLSDADKKLIIHVELSIPGGHILMATDAPESMGFKLDYGSNMHINLEPESREETKRLFDALSEGGKVTMPLEDMFFGSYFGSCTDQFGVNWMFNFANS
ncbi:MAG: SRPBCC domain-containing protein [Puia sp.]|nr:SRPBCC domain-containing protein [Puia sp.]